jgi:hypothetical protein
MDRPTTDGSASYDAPSWQVLGTVVDLAQSNGSTITDGVYSNGTIVCGPKG